MTEARNGGQRASQKPGHVGLEHGRDRLLLCACELQGASHGNRILVGRPAGSPGVNSG